MVVVFGLNGTSSPSPPLAPHAPYLPPGFNTLIDIVGERAAGDEAASPLGHMQVAVFQHDLALADDHQRRPSQLHPFKNVILCSLEIGWGKVTDSMGVGREERGTQSSSLFRILRSVSPETELPGSQEKLTVSLPASRREKAPGD
jgi:hypothetical protein